MRHYHRTPIAETAEESTRFLHNRHALVPFHQPADAPLAFEVCRSVALDHGAVDIARDGGQLDLDGYIRWCEEWHRHPGFDWALIPDLIDGDEADNDALLRAWPKRIVGVPIYHLQEDPGRLLRLAESYPLVALRSGPRSWSLAGTTGWWGRMAIVLDAICDEHGRPLCKLHGQQMMAPDIFTALPLASVDGSCADMDQRAGRFGRYQAPAKLQRNMVLADRLEALTSAPAWQRPQQQLMYTGPRRLVL